jgi:hypothetical protein
VYEGGTLKLGLDLMPGYEPKPLSPDSKTFLLFFFWLFLCWVVESVFAAYIGLHPNVIPTEKIFHIFAIMEITGTVGLVAIVFCRRQSLFHDEEIQQ